MVSESMWTWLQGLLLNVIFSAVFSSLFSSIFWYLFYRKKFKQEAEAGYIQEKVFLYSSFLYCILQLEKQLELKGDDYVFKKEEVCNIITELDNRLKKNLHLLSSEILRLWLEIRTVICYKPVLGHLRKLRELLRHEYNEEIIPKYRKIVGEEPRELII